MKPIHIALAFDERYAPHGGATIASVLANAAPEDELQFHVLNNGLLISTRDQLQRFVESHGAKIHFLTLDLKRYSNLPKTVHTDAMYARLALPELIPELDQILYLDSDVVVLSSLRILWEAFLPEKLCWVVQDAADVFKGPFLDHKIQIGLTPSTSYFNSGVLLINMAQWRNQDIVKKVIRFLEQPGVPVAFPDQDALNAVLQNQIIFLDPKWNVQAPLIRAVRYGVIHNPEWIAAVRAPAIIHYTTDEKPWKPSCVVPRRADYQRYIGMMAVENRGTSRPAPKDLVKRFCAELMEFRWWLAAAVKGRLRSI